MMVSIGRANEEISKLKKVTSSSYGSYGIEYPSGKNEFAVSSNGTKYVIGQRAFFADAINVSYAPSLEVKRTAGQVDLDQMYKQKDNISCTIDIDYYISTNHNPNYGDPYLFMRDDIEGGNNTGKNFFPIIIGDNIYNKCYLNNLSVDIKPFEPVKCRASFRATQPASGQPLRGMYVAQNFSGSPNKLLSGNSFVLGSSCELSGWISNVTNLDSISQIRFSRTYGRKDVYCLGDEVPRESLIKNVDNVMNISATGIKELVSSAGIRISGDAAIIFKDSNGQRVETQPLDGGAFYPLDPCVHIHSGGYITNQIYSAKSQDVVTSTITLSEALL